MISATLEISGKPIRADLLNVEEYIIIKDKELWHFQMIKKQ